MRMDMGGSEACVGWLFIEGSDNEGFGFYWKHIVGPSTTITLGLGWAEMGWCGN